jgi:hypothetical protein
MPEASGKMKNLWAILENPVFSVSDDDLLDAFQQLLQLDYPEEQAELLVRIRVEIKYRMEKGKQK